MWGWGWVGAGSDAFIYIYKNNQQKKTDKWAPKIWGRRGQHHPDSGEDQGRQREKAT